MKKLRITTLTYLLFIFVILLTACSQQALPEDRSSEIGKLKVVATTTIVGDVVSQIGGDLIDLSVLLPVGTDPHSFDPTPQDIAKVSEADIVFANGAGLEEFLAPLIESAGVENQVVYLSDGIELLARPTQPDAEADDHGSGDPHTWIDPNNVMVWSQHIEQALSAADAPNTASYQANAEKYQAELQSLDAWIREQIAQIPVENRKLVTDHTLFGYYAEEYGLEQVGALIPGYSTLAEPSAQDLAEIEDAISTLGVKAIFVGNTVNPMLAERVAADTGTELVFVYTGSLSNPGEDASTYLDYMRYNTRAIVEALTPNP